MDGRRRPAGKKRATDVEWMGASLFCNSTGGNRLGYANISLTCRLFLTRPDLLARETVESSQSADVRKVLELLKEYDSK